MPDDQFERAGVIGVRVRNENRIGRINRVEVRQLIVAQAPAHFGRGTNAGVNQQSLAANFDEETARADFVRATEEGDSDYIFAFSG